MARPSGRRPGDSGTREAIRETAARQFAEVGYDRASMRSIARDAGVDPSLIVHFFGTKHRLFAEVVELPFSAEHVVPLLLDGPRSEIGRRLAEFIVTTLEVPEARRRILGIVRAAASEPEAATMIRALLSREVVARIAAVLETEDAELRATLVGSQIVGLVMARYVVALEPLASLSPDAVARAIAPNLQRYLTEPLGLD